jgi:hypothetical protein
VGALVLINPGQFPSPAWPSRCSGSEEEREHAELLMDYQNKRGGRVQLRSMVGPQADFDHPEKVWEGCEGLNLEGPK